MHESFNLIDLIAKQITKYFNGYFTTNLVELYKHEYGKNNWQVDKFMNSIIKTFLSKITY